VLNLVFREGFEAAGLRRRLSRGHAGTAEWECGRGGDLTTICT